MLKKSLLLLMFLAAACYAIALAGWVFVYILAIALLFYTTVFLTVSNLYWATLPPTVKQSYARAKGMLRFYAKLVGCFLLLFLALQAINYWYMPQTSFALRMSVKAALVIFLGFLGWYFLKRVRTRFTITSVAVILLSVIMAPLFGPDKQAPVAVSPKNALAGLRTLPYVGWVQDEQNAADKINVVKHDPNRAFKGMNIYTARSLAKVMLVDMGGEVLRSWVLTDSTADQVWPYATLCENGDILALQTDKMLVRADWDGNILWRRKMRAHHDIFLANNGDIYVLGWKDKLEFFAGLAVPVLHDYIAVLDSRGKLKRKVSIFDAMQNKIPSKRILALWKAMIKPQCLGKIILSQWNHGNISSNNGFFDVLHTNSLQLLDKNIQGVCQKGDALISCPKLDMIAILDIEAGRLRWTWGPGIMSMQHHPTLLENDNILVFDNGTVRDYSRILELDPRTRLITWQYVGEPKESFFTSTRGSCQRLPNGNTLITETNKGHVFEITKEGEVVWQFFCPNITEDTQQREIIYRMTRIVQPEKYKHLMELIVK